MCRLVAVRVLGLNTLLFRNEEKCSITALAPHSHTRPFVLSSIGGALWEEEAPLWIAGNNVLLTGNQRDTHTSWQHPDNGSEVGICINVGKKTYFLHMWKARCAHWRKKRSLNHQGSSSSSSGTSQGLLAEQVCSGCAAQGSLLMAGRRQRPAAAPYPTWFNARFSTQEIKELLEHWEQPERQKDFMSQCVSVFRAEGDIRDFGWENDLCHQVFGFCNILFDSE